MSDRAPESNAKYVVGTVLAFGVLSLIFLLQEHYIAGGAAALAAVIYAGRVLLK